MARVRCVCGLMLCGLLLAAGVLGSSPAYAGKRVALIMGNNSYSVLPALNNAEKDARDVAASLRAGGWEVVDLYNATQRNMGRAIDKFEGLLATADAALFFYAGHGIQARSENWLVPIDANVEAEVDLEYEAISARKVLQAMKRADVPVNILILDACRDNPLKKRTRSASRGLAAPEVPSGLRGTAILFSAAPGEVAQDGPQGGNGVFTGALLKELSTPGRSLEEVFKATARQVAAVTNKGQSPWFNSSLSGDFYFTPKAAAPVAAAQTTAPTGSPGISADTQAQFELAFWEAIKDSNDEASFQTYVTQYPSGRFTALANLKIQQLSAKKVAALTPQPSQAVRNSTPSADIGSIKPEDIKYLDYRDETGEKIRLEVFDYKDGDFIFEDNTKIILGLIDTREISWNIYRISCSSDQKLLGKSNIKIIDSHKEKIKDCIINKNKGIFNIEVDDSSGGNEIKWKIEINSSGGENPNIKIKREIIDFYASGYMSLGTAVKYIGTTVLSDVYYDSELNIFRKIKHESYCRSNGTWARKEFTLLDVK